jgi:hypothetical protein
MTALPPPSFQALTATALATRVREQLESERTRGAFAGCADAVLDEAATRSVAGLWATSRIKTYLPILALRRAHELLEPGAGDDRTAG